MARATSLFLAKGLLLLAMATVLAQEWEANQDLRRLAQKLQLASWPNILYMGFHVVMLCRSCKLQFLRFRSLEVPQPGTASS